VVAVSLVLVLYGVVDVLEVGFVPV
jgi:hypothetical protein